MPIVLFISSFKSLNHLKPLIWANSAPQIKLSQVPKVSVMYSHFDNDVNNGSISIIGKDGGLLKQEITTVPFEVESVIPYLQWIKSTGCQASIKHI